MPAARSESKDSSASGSSRTLVGARSRGVAAARSARVRRGRRAKPSARSRLPITRRLGASPVSASRRALMSGTERFALRSSITLSRTCCGGLLGGPSRCCRRPEEERRGILEAAEVAGHGIDRADGVAEAPGHRLGGLALEEEGAQDLVAAMERAAGLSEEVSERIGGTWQTPRLGIISSLKQISQDM